MIRPSLLPLAAKCGYAVTLAEQYPEGSDASERGNAFHKAMADYIRTRQGSARLASIFATLPAHVKAEAEVPVKLIDPDTGEVLSEGTTDVILEHDDASGTVVDFKTGNPDKVDPPDDNLQILTYGESVALERGWKRFRVGLFFTEHPPLRLSRWFVQDEYGAVLAKIRAAMTLRRDTPIVGAHCDRCYRRKYCRAWGMAAVEAETAMAKFDPAELTTPEKVGRLVLGIQAAQERLDAMLTHCRDYARHNRVEVDGRVYLPVLVNGRRSVSVDSLEQAGLLEEAERRGAIKEGRPYERFGWKNANSKAGKETGPSSDW